MINYTRQIAVKHNVDICVVERGPRLCRLFPPPGTGFRPGHRRPFHAWRHEHRDPGTRPDAVSDGINFLAGGIGHETYLRAQESGAMRGGAIHAENLKYLYEDMMAEAGIAISYNTTLMDVDLDGQGINAAICHAKSGLFAIQAKIFIDCSGMETWRHWRERHSKSGTTTETRCPQPLLALGRSRLEPISRRQGISHNDDNMLAILKQAYEQGVISMDDYHHGNDRSTSLSRNFSHVFGINPLDELSVTKGLIDNRKLLREYETMYRQFIRGFQSASLATSGSILGIRESRRIIAEYVLSAQDYDNRATFEDEIGRYNFSIDVHPSTPGRQALEEHKKHFRGKAYGKGESYGIPYRILCPKNTDNLLVAGRCVSADRNMMASLRVIPVAGSLEWPQGQPAISVKTSKSQTRSTSRLSRKPPCQRRISFPTSNPEHQRGIHNETPATALDASILASAQPASLKWQT